MNAEFLPITAAAIIIMFMAVTLKEIKREYALVLTVVGTVILAVWGISQTEPILQRITELMELGEIDTGYSETLIKALGISICSKVGKDICCDAGETALGSKVDFCGKVCLLVLALPIFDELLSLAKNILLA